LRYDGDFAVARAALLGVLRDSGRAQVVEDEGDYVRVVFKSMVFRFSDDVEFLFDDPAKTIHLKSASRVGYSDLGVNRRRCEAIRERFKRYLEEIR